MLPDELTLFEQPLKLQDFLPWVVVAIAVIMLVTILGKCVSIYRNIKRNRTYVKRDDQPSQQLLTIRGEYFVLNSGAEYSVGEHGQINAGKYLLRGDGYDKFQLSINGELKDFVGDSTVEFADGDVIKPGCNVLIKPIANEEEQI